MPIMHLRRAPVPSAPSGRHGLRGDRRDDGADPPFRVSVWEHMEVAIGDGEYTEKQAGAIHESPPNGQWGVA